MALTLLVQFVLRLSFGLAVAMTLTPSRLVSSGFYRVHLWVLLGLCTLAGVAAFFHRMDLPTEDRATWTCVVLAALVAGIASYVGAVFWLYEKSTVGKAALIVIAVATLTGAMLSTAWKNYDEPSAVVLATLDLAAGGLLLGVTITAMFLGHWYLNTPTMQLVPLERLVLLMGAAVLVRSILAGVGLWLQLSEGVLGSTMLWFVLLRWMSGLLGTLVLAIMAWQTLKIPNTQSATGILYVGVIVCFLGELTSQLLSVQTLYPL